MARVLAMTVQISYLFHGRQRRGKTPSAKASPHPDESLSLKSHRSDEHSLVVGQESSEPFWIPMLVLSSNELLVPSNQVVMLRPSTTDAHPHGW